MFVRPMRDDGCDIVGVTMSLQIQQHFQSYCYALTARCGTDLFCLILPQGAMAFPYQGCFPDAEFRYLGVFQSDETETWMKRKLMTPNAPIKFVVDNFELRNYCIIVEAGWKWMCLVNEVAAAC